MGDLRPDTALTLWSLLAFAIGALLVGLPMYMQVRAHRRTVDEWKQKDGTKTLTLQLDDPTIKTKVIETVRPIVEGAIKLHDDNPFAHRTAFDRYTSDTVNGAIARISGEIAAVRTLIEQIDRQRNADLQALRGDIKEAKDDQRAALRELKENIARILGERAVV